MFGDVLNFQSSKARRHPTQGDALGYRSVGPSAQLYASDAGLAYAALRSVGLQPNFTLGRMRARDAGKFLTLSPNVANHRRQNGALCPSAWISVAMCGKIGALQQICNDLQQTFNGKGPPQP